MLTIYLCLVGVTTFFGYLFTPEPRVAQANLWVCVLSGLLLVGVRVRMLFEAIVHTLTAITVLLIFYTAMQTGVYFGWIMFPSAWVNFKLNEVAKHYTEIGFGAITWHGLTINKNRFNRLPKDVQDIIVEVGREYEAKTGTVNEEGYPKQIEQLKTIGVTVKAVPDAVKLEWAQSLKAWPQEKATELDKQGLPATQVLKIALEEAEKLGHKWPLRYEIK